MIAEDGDHPVLFQPVDPYVSPRWLDPTYPSQLHLDVEVEEIEAAERAVRELGATRLPGHGDNWRVHADPAGKPFCLQSTVG